jgi:hypothetical protein
MVFSFVQFTQQVFFEKSQKCGVKKVMSLAGLTAAVGDTDLHAVRASPLRCADIDAMLSMKKSSQRKRRLSTAYAPTPIHKRPSPTVEASASESIDKELRIVRALSFDNNLEP